MSVICLSDCHLSFLVISAALTPGRIITGLSMLAFWALLETGDEGLAGPDNPGLQPAPTEPSFAVGRAACTGLFGMAATSDNDHIDEKCLNKCSEQPRRNTILLLSISYTDPIPSNSPPFEPNVLVPSGK